MLENWVPNIVLYIIKYFYLGEGIMTKNYDVKVFDYVEKATGAHIVKAVTTYEGKAVYAFAKCDPEDTFDYEFGKNLQFACTHGFEQQ